jgi:lipid II:glycine glycyltransferase (peptidoglycan interpeptide bridge formation enzyme)
MLRIEIFKDIPHNWDELIKSAGNEANICQSGYWARVIKILDKATPYFFQLKDTGDSVLAQALVFKRYSYDREKQRRIFPLPYLECLDGPAVFETSRVEVCTQLILNKLIRIARRTFATHINISPSHTSRHAFDEKIANIYRQLSFQVKKWTTYLVDLKKNEEELFRQLKHAARKCVKKCQREGLKVVEVKNYREFEQRYWLPYVQAEEYFGRKANPSNPATWDEDKEARYHYYIVENGNSRTLAVLGMYIFNGVATEIASGTMPLAYELKIPAQDLLHWEIMLKAKCMGCHIFDLAGVDPNPVAGSKEEGIRRFKEKWGGRYVEYYTYRKEMNPVLFWKILNYSKRLFLRHVS